MRNTTKSVRNVASGPSVNAVDLTIHGTGELAFDTTSATAVSLGTARRHGVADSIVGRILISVRIRVPLPVPNHWGMV